jgi:anti-anti-sigma regulatory factor
VFLSYAKKAGKVGSRVALTGMSLSVRNVFESVGFIGIFPVFPTINEALKYLKKPEGGTK